MNDGFVQSDIENRLLKDGDYWYLDALISYDIEFNKPKEVLLDIGGEFWRCEIDPVIRISKDTIYLFDLVNGDDLQFSYYGSYEYYPNTTTLVVTPISNKKFSTCSISSRIIAYRGDSFVVEWNDVDTGYRALFKVVDYAAMLQKEVDVRMEKVFAESGEVDESKVADLLIGEWSNVTELGYDNADYTELCCVDSVCGKLYTYPGSNYNLIFCKDGVLQKVYSDLDPSSGCEYMAVKLSWHYDSGNNLLTIVDNMGRSCAYTIKAINDNHLVWDYTVISTDKATYEIVETTYWREGFKRSHYFTDKLRIIDVYGLNL